MNDIDSSKLEGRRPSGPKVGGASAPAALRFPGLCPLSISPTLVYFIRLKAAVHWVRVNALSAESSPKLTWDAMGLHADSVRRLSVRAEPLTR